MCGFRDISNATNERTAILAIFPLAAVGNTINLILGLEPLQAAYLLANGNAFVFDYVSRQKVGGTHVNIWILKQLPVIPPNRYTHDLLTYIVPRVLELTYTAWDLRAFADDVWSEARQESKSAEEQRGKISNLQQAILRQWEENRDTTNGSHEGAVPPDWATHYTPRPTNPFPKPPFKWDEARRAQLRADLDGLYGHLYGLSRDELACILDTFPIVRRKDEARYGEYRTKRMVLEAYDRLQGLVARD
jgi:hypothetical protein